MSHIRIRQICLVAEDLDMITAELESIFAVEVAHRDPGVGKYGLHNVLIPFGNQLLEVVSPQDATQDTAAGRYLQRRGGDGGYMVIMQVPERAYPGYRQRAIDMGIRIVSEPGDGNPDTGGMQLHPKDLPGAIAELRWNTGEDQPDGPWWPAGPGWQTAKHTEIIRGIGAATIQSDDPTALARRWGEVLDEPVRTERGDTAYLALDGADIRFVPIADGRPDGLAELDIVATDKARALANADRLGRQSGNSEVSICGVRFKLV